MSHHRYQYTANPGIDPWLCVVLTATIGFLAVVGTNTAGNFYLSLRGDSPAFPHRFDQRYLALMGWGFLVPFVWGFSAKWLRVFMGLKTLGTGVLASALAVSGMGVILAVAGHVPLAPCLLVAGTAL